MVCKRLKCHDDLKVMLDNYGQYIDFQYRAVINIWFSVEIEDKISSLGIIYKKNFKRIKKN